MLATALLIEVGKYADLLVVAKHPGHTDQRDLINAKPSDVVDACGVQRAIDVTVDSKLVPNGTEKLADIESKLLAVQPKLTPLFDCTDAIAQAAYQGTPLAQ